MKQKTPQQRIEALKKKDPDAVIAIYQDGVRVGKEHSSQSPETKAKFELVELEIKGLGEKLMEKLNTLNDKTDRNFETGKATHEQAKITNGRVDELEKLRDQAQGGAAVLKGIWGVIAVSVLGATYALFNMYVEFHNLDHKIRVIVQEELQQFTLEELR